MTKKNFLKSILTTSALAATLLGAESAMATSLAAAASANTRVAAEWNPNGVPATGAVLKFRAAGEEIIIDTASNYIIDFDNKGTDTISVGGIAGSSISGFKSTTAMTPVNRTNVIRFDAGAANDFTITAEGKIKDLGVGVINHNNKGKAFILSPGANKKSDYTGVLFTGGVPAVADADIKIGSGEVTLGTFDDTVGRKVDHLIIDDTATAITSADVNLFTGVAINGKTGRLIVKDGHDINGTVYGGAADEGNLTFEGASTVTGDVGVGGNVLLSITTDGVAGKTVTFDGTVATKSLVINNNEDITKASVSVSQNVGIGASGITGSGGTLLFTDSKTLFFHNIAANATIIGEKIVVSVRAGEALTINAQSGVAQTIAGRILAADNTSNLIFSGAAANSDITLGQGLGAVDKPFLDTKIDNANDKITLGSNQVAHTKTLTFDDVNAQLSLKAGSAVSGTIRATGGNRGKIVVLGNTGTVEGVTVTTVDTTSGGNHHIGELNFSHDAAANSEFAYLAVGSKTVHFDAVNFNGAANDAGGIVVDLKNVGANTNNTGITIGAAVAAAKNVGGVKFIGNQHTATTPVTIAATGNLATAVNPLDHIDATGMNLILDGGNKVIHTNVIRANQVTLSNKLQLGVYNIDVAQPATWVVGDAEEYLILTKSVISTADAPMRELKFSADGAFALGQGVDLHVLSVTQSVGGAAAGIIGLDGNQTLAFGSIGTKAAGLVGIVVAGGANKVTNIRSIGNAAADLYADIVTRGLHATEVLNLGSGNVGVNVHGDIKANAAAGIVNIQGGSNIDGSIGKVNAYGEVQINTTGAVTVGAANPGSEYHAGKTTFQQDGILVLTDKVIPGADFGAITTVTGHTGTIQINTSQTIDNVGAEGFSLKQFTVGNNATLTVNAGSLFIDNLTTATNLTGNLDITDSNSKGTSIGTSAARFAEVDIAGDSKFNAIYANKITVVGGGDTTALVFDAADATQGTKVDGTANVLDGGSIGLVTGVGNVNILGSARLGGNITTAQLSLNGPTADKVVTFGGNTIAANLVQGASQLVLTQATKVTGIAAFDGSTVQTNGALTLTGPATFAGNNKIVYTYAPGAPIITLGANASTVAATDTITISRIPGSLTPTSGSTTIVFADAAGVAQDFTIAGGAAGANAISVAKDRLFAGTYDTKNKHITWEGVATAQSFANPGALSFRQVADFTSALAAFNNDPSRKADAEPGLRALIADLEKLNLEESSDAVTRLATQPSAQIAAAASVAGLNTMGDALSARMSETGATQTATLEGMSAGDASDKFGAWAQVRLSTAEQKLRKGTPGFKAKSFGGFVGVDTMLSDNASLGITAGNNNNTMKFKDAKAGDKLTGSSWLFGAYGSYEFANNFFVQGNAGVAQTSVKSKALRVTSGGKVTASGKYDVMGYAAEVRGGYNYKFEASTVSPTVGLRYNYFGDTSYTETGAGVQNLKVSSKSSGSLSAVAGVKLGTVVDMNGSAIMPEVHMNVDCALNQSAPKAGFSLDGSSMNFNYKGAKPSKFGYNFGASVMTQTDNIEYGVGYDANIADKYLAHQGSLKVRLAF